MGIKRPLLHPNNKRVFLANSSGLKCGCVPVMPETQEHISEPSSMYEYTICDVTQIRSIKKSYKYLTCGSTDYTNKTYISTEYREDTYSESSDIRVRTSAQTLYYGGYNTRPFLSSLDLIFLQLTQQGMIDLMRPPINNLYIINDQVKLSGFCKEMYFNIALNLMEDIILESDGCSEITLNPKTSYSGCSTFALSYASCTRYLWAPIVFGNNAHTISGNVLLEGTFIDVNLNVTRFDGRLLGGSISAIYTSGELTNCSKVEVKYLESMVCGTNNIDCVSFGNNMFRINTIKSIYGSDCHVVDCGKIEVTSLLHVHFSNCSEITVEEGACSCSFYNCGTITGATFRNCIFHNCTVTAEDCLDCEFVACTVTLNTGGSYDGYNCSERCSFINCPSVKASTLYCAGFYSCSAVDCTSMIDPDIEKVSSLKVDRVHARQWLSIVSSTGKISSVDISPEKHYGSGSLSLAGSRIEISNISVSGDYAMEGLTLYLEDSTLDIPIASSFTGISMYGSNLYTDYTTIRPDCRGRFEGIPELVHNGGEVYVDCNNITLLGTGHYANSCSGTFISCDKVQYIRDIKQSYFNHNNEAAIASHVTGCATKFFFVQNGVSSAVEDGAYYGVLQQIERVGGSYIDCIINFTMNSTFIADKRYVDLTDWHCDQGVGAKCFLLGAYQDESWMNNIYKLDLNITTVGDGVECMSTLVADYTGNPGKGTIGGNPSAKLDCCQTIQGVKDCGTCRYHYSTMYDYSNYI
jgi:hypothetical protein